MVGYSRRAIMETQSLVFLFLHAFILTLSALADGNWNGHGYGKSFISFDGTIISHKANIIPFFPHTEYIPE